MELNNKHITVMGLAKTGVACARFLASRSARVTATDLRDEQALTGVLRELAGLGIRFVLGRHEEADFTEADLVVVSPGVPQEHPLLAAARARGVAIISEVELAARCITAPLVAITGTNGKTTTTTLVGELFRASGFATYVGGNIGIPLVEIVEQIEHDQKGLISAGEAGGEEVATQAYMTIRPGATDDANERIRSKAAPSVVVAEISSFQLEWIEQFRPTVAALLNLSEDHLDRYDSYQAYIDAKLRIFENQGPEGYAVVNRDDERVWQAAQGLTARLFPFSRKQMLDEGISCLGSEIVYRQQGQELRFPIASFKLQGVHNLENIMAALACGLLLGCDQAKSQALLERFESLHHRTEFVREVAGVRYYEDSKATNVGSVAPALESFDTITLIAGGKDKGGSYGPLAPLVKERVRHLLLIGEAAERMERELGCLTDTRRAATLEEAVRLAAQLTPPGGVVLLSPACSSFDMFRDYEERAQRFIAAVKEL
jgi:UDP-N-acetylmuramoylalanine--D-glutamate ligase